MSGPASSVQPVRFWPDHFLEIGYVCVCAYDEVGVAPTRKLAAAMASCVTLWSFQVVDLSITTKLST